MKNIALMFSFVMLFACADKKKEIFTEVDSPSVETEKRVGTNNVETKVLSYNFDELNSLLTKENDTVYVVNFWATWCKPCVKELPAFEKLNAEYSEKKVKVLLVSLDFPDKLETNVIPFINKNSIHSQVVLLDDGDANSWISKVSEKWSGAIPATLIYNSSKRDFYEYSFTFEELETELNNFIN